jgi:hypothetical protein
MDEPGHTEGLLAELSVEITTFSTLCPETAVWRLFVVGGELSSCR